MLSVIIPHFNDIKNLKKCLKYLNKQKKVNFEVIISEGKKNFSIIDKNYKFKFIQVYNGYQNDQEARKFLALKKSKEKIICFLDSDNFIRNENFLKYHLDAFKFKDVGFAYSRFYEYRNSDNYLNKYFSLLGGNDPIAWYFDKNDRYEFGDKFSQKDEVILKGKNFSVYKFEYIIKTIGANGFFIRKKIIENLKIKKPENFLHIDSNIKAIQKSKYRKYALINCSLWHYTADKIFTNLKKRSIYYKNFYLKKKKYRTYKIIDMSNRYDLYILVKLILLNLFLIPPLVISILKFINTKKKEWLYHTFIINLFIINYTYVYTKNIFRK